ncbi:hypothetical protein BRADI_3g11203v3 [Brachypodium distachyon]|uniref:Uncharacterized protein n=1 Tax=Brachypodium distachyon TaxID=15368 RepID=A0A0Q3J8Q3_BRADI|nr:hypothetical protein BRADI_3g11203v3 [Brachypodium distachyon]PNT66415.1 hypothetical protein BRADI_3g11203v3 [Brachypodium distachyon]PNT66416.1 hypothetical protein BRADI_3g11203v3 [Brachypodium distachyon]
MAGPAAHLTHLRAPRLRPNSDRRHRASSSVMFHLTQTSRKVNLRYHIQRLTDVLCSSIGIFLIFAYACSQEYIYAILYFLFPPSWTTSLSSSSSSEMSESSSSSSRPAKLCFVRFVVSAPSPGGVVFVDCAAAARRRRGPALLSLAELH